jgi:hypothetical protein
MTRRAVDGRAGRPVRRAARRSSRRLAGVARTIHRSSRRGPPAARSRSRLAADRRGGRLARWRARARRPAATSPRRAATGRQRLRRSPAPSTILGPPQARQALQHHAGAFDRPGAARLGTGRPSPMSTSGARWRRPTSRRDPRLARSSPSLGSRSRPVVAVLASALALGGWLSPAHTGARPARTFVIGGPGPHAAGTAVAAAGRELAPSSLGQDSSAAARGARRVRGDRDRIVRVDSQRRDRARPRTPPRVSFRPAVSPVTGRARSAGPSARPAPPGRLTTERDLRASDRRSLPPPVTGRAPGGASGSAWCAARSAAPGNTASPPWIEHRAASALPFFAPMKSAEATQGRARNGLNCGR